MPDLTATAQNELVDALTGKSNTSFGGSTQYITLFNGDPQGSGSEVLNTVTGSANRPAIASSMGNASSGSSSSTSDITFTNNASGAATVDYIAIYDAQTGGNLLASTSVTSKSVASGDGVSISSGNLTIAIT